jgi:hypothetical protein
MDDPNNTIVPPQLLDLSLSPQEATAKLGELSAAVAPPAPPIDPQNATDARRRMDVLIADREWGARFFAGHMAERKEFQALQDRIAAGDSVSIWGAAPPGSEFDFSSEDKPSQHVLNETVKMYRDAGVGDGAIAQALKGTPESAEAVAAVRVFHNQKMSDPEWRTKLLSGDVTAKREFYLMSIVLAGAPA